MIERSNSAKTPIIWNSALPASSTSAAKIGCAIFRPVRGRTKFITLLAVKDMQEWVAAAKAEPDELDELDIEF
jgi:hypothetical protein